MLVKVHVTPNARAPLVVEVEESNLEVGVAERAEGGEANKRLLELLSEH